MPSLTPAQREALLAAAADPEGRVWRRTFKQKGFHQRTLDTLDRWHRLLKWAGPHYQITPAGRRAVGEMGGSMKETPPPKNMPRYLAQELKNLEGHSALDCLIIRDLFESKEAPTPKEIVEALRAEFNYHDNRLEEFQRYIDDAIKLVELANPGFELF